LRRLTRRLIGLGRGLRPGEHLIGSGADHIGILGQRLDLAA
jgi:hypothetical protein